MATVGFKGTDYDGRRHPHSVHNVDNAVLEDASKEHDSSSGLNDYIHIVKPRIW